MVDKKDDDEDLGLHWMGRLTTRPTQLDDIQNDNV